MKHSAQSLSDMLETGIFTDMLPWIYGLCHVKRSIQNLYITTRNSPGLQPIRNQQLLCWCKDPPPSPQGEAAMTLGGIPTWSFFQCVIPLKSYRGPKRKGENLPLPSFFREETVELRGWKNPSAMMNQASAMNKSTTLETIYSWRIDFEPAKNWKKHIKHTIFIQTHWIHVWYAWYIYLH